MPRGTFMSHINLGCCFYSALRGLIVNLLESLDYWPCSWASLAHWRRRLCHTRRAASCTTLCRDHRRHPGPETEHSSRLLQRQIIIICLHVFIECKLFRASCDYTIITPINGSRCILILSRSCTYGSLRVGSMSHSLQTPSSKAIYKVNAYVLNYLVLSWGVH